ncbi:hypothetical protein ACFRMN_00730 [Streptomyces sp. NPDC056835]|uniref:hypothetical protein n=1 Tax=Streptomyces sp. NPDC056835 TaxID=3345956 RepID=UPI0036BD6925
MASFVYFRKVAETGDSVEYVFGFDTDEPPRRLLVDVKSHRSRPMDGEIDYAFLKASRKINALREEASRWPDQGTSIS